MSTNPTGDFTAIDNVFRQALHAKGERNNVEAIRLFELAITMLLDTSTSAANNPVEETLDRIQEAREFIERTNRAISREANAA